MKKIYVVMTEIGTLTRHQEVIEKIFYDKMEAEYYLKKEQKINDRFYHIDTYEVFGNPDSDVGSYEEKLKALLQGLDIKDIDILMTKSPEFLKQIGSEVLKRFNKILDYYLKTIGGKYGNK